MRTLGIFPDSACWYTQFLEAEPGHFESGLNGKLAEPLQEERFTGPRR